MNGNKGFISIYLLTVLAVCLLIAHGIYSEMYRCHGFISERENFRKMNWLEVLAIKRTVQNFRCYSCVNETLYIDGYSVSFLYRDLSCTITISGNGYIRIRCLEYDDINDEVLDYQ